FALDEEPQEESSAPSPRVVSSSSEGSGPSASPTPAGGSSPGAASPSFSGGPSLNPSLNGAGSEKDFWRALVVAAVSAGKDADSAMSLADAIVRAARD
ncbi:MAG TPA: hypothetical protein DEF51_55355, partial [Myxococcales bacterium]|nr:hypothetical protein [Myxococcales bacterium]